MKRTTQLLKALPEKKEMTRKKEQRYPPGWDEKRIRKLAEHHDNQSEDKQVAEHEAAFRAEGQTVMVVPTELVPEIVKLIGKKSRGGWHWWLVHQCCGSARTRAHAERGWLRVPEQVGAHAGWHAVRFLSACSRQEVSLPPVEPTTTGLDLRWIAS